MSLLFPPSLCNPSLNSSNHADFTIQPNRLAHIKRKRNNFQLGTHRSIGSRAPIRGPVSVSAASTTRPRSANESPSSSALQSQNHATKSPFQQQSTFSGATNSATYSNSWFPQPRHPLLLPSSYLLQLEHTLSLQRKHIRKYVQYPDGLVNGAEDDQEEDNLEEDDTTTSDISLMNSGEDDGQESGTASDFSEMTSDEEGDVAMLSVEGSDEDASDAYSLASDSEEDDTFLSHHAEGGTSSSNRPPSMNISSSSLEDSSSTPSPIPSSGGDNSSRRRNTSSVNMMLMGEHEQQLFRTSPAQVSIQNRRRRRFRHTTSSLEITSGSGNDSGDEESVEDESYMARDDPSMMAPTASIEETAAMVNHLIGDISEMLQQGRGVRTTERS